MKQFEIKFILIAVLPIYQNGCNLLYHSPYGKCSKNPFVRDSWANSSLTGQYGPLLKLWLAPLIASLTSVYLNIKTHGTLPSWSDYLTN